VLPVQVTVKLSQVGLIDFVLFCVTNPDTETVVQAIQPDIGPGITVMSLQHGIDVYECINAVVGKELKVCSKNVPH
jgi:ketopantoate reductase